jgi:hypothetical protein
LRAWIFPNRGWPALQSSTMIGEHVVRGWFLSGRYRSLLAGRKRESQYSFHAKSNRNRD